MAAEPHYEASASLVKRIEESYIDTKVYPEWTDRSGVFWYKKSTTKNKYESIIVDAEKRVRQPAFDHENLAKALTEHGIEAQSDALPFKHINISEDLGTVRFRIEDKKWKFNDGVLSEYHGEIAGDTLTPLDEEQPSECSDDNTSVAFINRSKDTISLYWIDFDSKAKFYTSVKRGGRSKRATYVGHVWRVTKKDTDDVVAIFAARHSDADAIITEDMVAGAKPQKPPEESSTSHPDPPSSSDNEPHIFIRDDKIFTVTNGHETQLTHQGSPSHPFDPRKIHLSPSKTHAVIYQYTPSSPRQLTHIESAPKDSIQPQTHSQPYLKPGDAVRIDRPRLFSLLTNAEIPTSDALFTNPFKIRHLHWSPDSREYRFLCNTRGHKRLAVLGISVTGAVRTILAETSETFVDYSQKLYWTHIPATDELVWASERSGWSHLYLCDLRGGRLRQLTGGGWNVYNVELVDFEHRRIWFSAIGMMPGQDCYNIHLARVDFSSSSSIENGNENENLKILTKGNASHTIAFSPDFRYILDTYSRADLAPVSTLLSSEGEHILTLETGTLTALLSINWTIPSPLVFPGRDGIPIHGLIITPSHLDPGKSYPVIEDIYAGPHSFSVPHTFSPLTHLHEIAELGFIVVKIDGQGSNWRGKAFQEISHRNLRYGGFPDRVAWMKAAAATRPWMDLSRAGVVGSSAGGQNALAALLWHGDFYKVAVADSGCHDNRVDKLWWGEAYMGWPVDEAYEGSSNVVHAGRLRGKLMLIVGELDDNVDPACTMQVVAALNRAGKEYELLVMPGEDHGVGMLNEYARRRWKDFFVRCLMGIRPPDRNAE